MLTRIYGADRVDAHNYSTVLSSLAFAGTIVANIGAQKSSANTTTNATVGFSPIVNLYVAVSFGFSLLVNVWIFFRVYGGLFNPAVTLGMVMTKTISYTRGASDIQLEGYNVLTLYQASSSSSPSSQAPSSPLSS